MSDQNPKRFKTAFEDLSGQTFNKLTVVRIVGEFNGSATLWDCICNCKDKNATMATTNQLMHNNKKSCGCLKVSYTGVPSSKNKKKTPEHNAWSGMKKRCFSTTSNCYERYGGRGITMCNRWRYSFPSFHEDVGLRPSPSHSIDRIENNGHYSCGKCEQCIANGWTMNVRWATRAEQMRNTTSNVMITIDGITKCCEDWSRINGIHKNTILGRIMHGWDHVSAATLPPDLTRRFLYDRDKKKKSQSTTP